MDVGYQWQARLSDKFMQEWKSREIAGSVEAREAKVKKGYQLSIPESQKNVIDWLLKRLKGQFPVARMRTQTKEQEEGPFVFYDFA